MTELNGYQLFGLHIMTYLDLLAHHATKPLTNAVEIRIYFDQAQLASALDKLIGLDYQSVAHHEGVMASQFLQRSRLCDRDDRIWSKFVVLNVLGKQQLAINLADSFSRHIDAIKTMSGLEWSAA